MADGQLGYVLGRSPDDRHRAWELWTVVQLVGTLGVGTAVGIGRCRRRQPDRVGSAGTFVRRRVPHPVVLDTRGVPLVASVGHLPGDDRRSEVEGVVVHRWLPGVVARVPDVEAVLLTVVETQAEEPEVLHLPRVVLGMLEDGVHQGFVQWVLHVQRVSSGPAGRATADGRRMTALLFGLVKRATVVELNR